MKTAKDFQWSVAITQQDTVALVATCPACGHAMQFTDNGDAGIRVGSMLQQHACYMKIVSVPKI